MDWKPNKEDSLPLYRQITDYFKNKIGNGEWPVGTTIPAQRDLARYFGVNRSTIATAIDELIAEGLLEGRVGSGTRVINNTWVLLASLPAPDWNSYVAAGVHQPNLATIQAINQAEFSPGIIRLGTGELSPELYPAQLMQNVLSSLAKRINSLGYEEPKGLPALRQALSTHLKIYGIEASPSSILIVSGALQALQLISWGLLNPGSAVMLEKPSYLFSLNLFQSAGMHFHGLPLDSEGIRPDQLAYHTGQGKATLLYTIPCFHNPTGTLMSLERREQLLALCKRNQLPVLEDDVYRDLWLDTPPPAPLKSLDRNGLVIYIGSLSKTLSPGLRIGWVVGPETVINRLADIKMQNDYGSSSLSQWAAAEWLSSGLYAQHLANIRKSLVTRRNICNQILQEHFADIATWTLPAGGFYIWLNLTKPVSLQKLFKAALKENLLINPGNMYDRLSNQQIRISYSYASLDELHSGLRRLSNIIRQMQGPTGVP